MGSSSTDYNLSIFFLLHLSCLVPITIWGLEPKLTFCAKANITLNNILLKLKFKFLIYFCTMFYRDVLRLVFYICQNDLNKIRMIRKHDIEEVVCITTYSFCCKSSSWWIQVRMTNVSFDLDSVVRNRSFFIFIIFSIQTLLSSVWIYTVENDAHTCT